MPTLVRDGDIRIEVRPNDHPPPHCHAEIGGYDVMIALGGAPADVRILNAHPNVKSVDGRRAKGLVREHHPRLLGMWRTLHG